MAIPKIIFILIIFKMQLTQLDRDIQDRIIQKIHWVWLEEAKIKELINWCLLTNWHSDDTLYMFTYMEWHAWKEFAIFHRAPEDPQEIYWSKYEIIWLPPTLDRVLYVLWSRYIYHHVYRYIYKEYDLDTYTDWKDAIILKTREYCERKLLNDDWTSATLRDQSVSTKEKIYQIIK